VGHSECGFVIDCLGICVLLFDDKGQNPEPDFFIEVEKKRFIRKILWLYSQVLFFMQW